jgi:hypothetical protein
MTPAMAQAGAADGQAPGYAPAESSWAPSVPQPQVDPMPQMEFAPQIEPAPQPAPDFEFIPAPTSAPASAPQQAATPATPRILTAGGRIQVHCPACGAGNAIANRTCILCGKKLPLVS